MVIRFLIGLLGRAGSKAPDSVEPDTPKPDLTTEQKKSLTKFLEYNVSAIDRHAQSQQLELPYAILKPVIPIEDSLNSDGWFGGRPKLPSGSEWPQIRGNDALFVCQINCASLPKNIWAGAGPRDGWLAIFLLKNWPYEPEVLHFQDAEEFFDGPEQGSADWFLPREYSKPLHKTSPQWPISVVGHAGQQPPPAGTRKGAAKEFPDPRKTWVRDISAEAFRPFDVESSRLMFASIRNYLSSRLEGTQKLQKSITSNPKSTTEDKSFLATVVQQLEAAQGEFNTIDNDAVKSLDEVGYDAEAIDALIARISRIAVPEFKRLDEGEYQAGEPSFSVVMQPLNLRPGILSLHLDEYAKHIYCGRPDDVPTALRTRLEDGWRFDAAYETGAMGHSPILFLYEEFGPGTPNEVLLELPTNDLVGWIWGDLYSLVFLIDRKDLSQGNFEKVSCVITN